VAAACRERGIRSAAVTAGYVKPAAREALFGSMDAANVDLKSLDDDFYRKVCFGRLAPVLETLEAIAASGRTWLEITTLLIPGLEHLGPGVPLHFTAFHPDFRMLDRPQTAASTLSRARAIGVANGLRYVYTGNVHDPEGQTTRCHACGTHLIGRDGYHITAWDLTAEGRCGNCGEPCPGVFEAEPGGWGARRQPIRIGVT